MLSADPCKESCNLSANNLRRFINLHKMHLKCLLSFRYLSSNFSIPSAEVSDTFCPYSMLFLLLVALDICNANLMASASQPTTRGGTPSRSVSASRMHGMLIWTHSTIQRGFRWSEDGLDGLWQYPRDDAHTLKTEGNFSDPLFRYLNNIFAIIAHWMCSVIYQELSALPSRSSYHGDSSSVGFGPTGRWSRRHSRISDVAWIENGQTTFVAIKAAKIKWKIVEIICVNCLGK